MRKACIVFVTKIAEGAKLTDMQRDQLNTYMKQFNLDI